MTRPGVTALGEYAVGDLPATYDGSTPSLFASVIANRPDRIILLVAKPRIPGSGGQTVTVYAASDEYSTWPSDTPSNQIFRARLLSAYNVQYSLWGGLSQLPIPKTTLDGKSAQLPAVKSAPSYGITSFVAADGQYDGLTRLSWIGCSLAHYVVTRGAPFASAVQISSFVCGGITWDPKKIDISIRDLQQDFQLPLQSETYTTGAISIPSVVTPAATSILANPSGARSLGAWVKPSIDSSSRRDLAGWPGTVKGSCGVYFNTSGSNYLSVFVVNDAGTTFTYNDNLSFPAGTWIRVNLVLDVAGGHLYLYVNRALRGSVVISGAFTTIVNNFTISNAIFSEMRIWSMARSLPDIALNTYLTYPCAAGGAYANLYAYYTFSESSGATSSDQTGARPVITLNGASWDVGDWQQAQCLGKTKPVALGELKYPAEVPLQLVDSNAPGALVYQFHHRPAQGVLSVRHAGLALNLGAGDYTLDLYRGYVFVHVNVTATMTADVQGDLGVFAPDGLGYVNRKADLVVRIATLYAGRPYLTGVDLSSVSDLNIKDSAPYGLFINSSQTLADAMDSLLDGCAWTFNRQGQLSLGRLDLPGAANEDIDQTKIVYGSLSRLATLEPSKRQRVGYNHNYTPQPAAQLSTSLSNADRDLLSRPDSFVAPGANMALVADYPYATDVQTLTLRYDQTAANVESVRAQTLFGQAQDIYKFRVVNSLFKHWLFDAVTVTYHEEVAGGEPGTTVVRYDLSGRKFVIIGIVEVASTDPGQPDTTEYTVWGVRQDNLIIDTSTSDRLIIDTVTGDRLKIDN